MILSPSTVSISSRFLHKQGRTGVPLGTLVGEPRARRLTQVDGLQALRGRAPYRL